MAKNENDKKRTVLPRVFTTLFTLLYLGWIFSNSLATAQQSGAASGEKHIDQIIAATRLPAARITSALTLLQIKGYVRALPGKRFSLAEKQS